MTTIPLTIKQAAKALGKSRTTLHSWTKSGFIKHVKTGPTTIGYKQSEIDRILAGVPVEDGE